MYIVAQMKSVCVPHLHVLTVNIVLRGYSILVVEPHNSNWTAWTSGRSILKSSGIQKSNSVCYCTYDCYTYMLIRTCSVPRGDTQYTSKYTQHTSWYACLSQKTLKKGRILAFQRVFSNFLNIFSSHIFRKSGWNLPSHLRSNIQIS